jgi:hypothetical protein
MKAANKHPWDITPLTKDEARAFSALREGVASDIQQKRAIEVIVNKLCAMDDLEFRPDDAGGERASAFAAGKRHVGLQLRKWLFANGSLIESLPD